MFLLHHGGNLQSPAMRAAASGATCGAGCYVAPGIARASISHKALRNGALPSRIVIATLHGVQCYQPGIVNYCNLSSRFKTAVLNC